MVTIQSRKEVFKNVEPEEEPSQSGDDYMGMMIQHLQQLDSEMSFITGEVTRMKRDMLMLRNGLAALYQEVKRGTESSGDTATATADVRTK